MHYLDRMRHARFEGLGKRDNFSRRFIDMRCGDDYIFAESVFPDTGPIKSFLPPLRVYAHRAEQFNASCEHVT